MTVESGVDYELVQRAKHEMEKLSNSTTSTPLPKAVENGSTLCPLPPQRCRGTLSRKNSEVEVVPSEIGRGIKFGIGFALGFGVILLLLLFGLSMCAGHLHRRMMERMEEMIPEKKSPAPETGDEPIALATSKQVEAGMQGHMLAQAELMGRYRR